MTGLTARQVVDSKFVFVKQSQLSARGGRLVNSF
jgi:hypothetical protein